MVHPDPYSDLILNSFFGPCCPHPPHYQATKILIMPLYEPHSCMPSNEWEYGHMIVMQVSEALSCLGSGSIIEYIWKKWRRRRSSVDLYQRIMAKYNERVRHAPLVFHLRHEHLNDSAGNQLVARCRKRLYLLRAGFSGCLAGPASWRIRHCTRRRWCS